LLCTARYQSKFREEEQEAARAYAEFVDAFDTESASKGRRGAFVKAGGREEVYAPMAREVKDTEEQVKVTFALIRMIN
jgi:hypothetical protein